MWVRCVFLFVFNRGLLARIICLCSVVDSRGRSNRKGEFHVSVFPCSVCAVLSASGASGASPAGRWNLSTAAVPYMPGNVAVYSKR